MKQNLSKQSATILSILLFTIAIMLSGNVFSAKNVTPPPVDMATQTELDAVVATQATTDAGQNSVNTAQQAAIDDLKARLDKLAASVGTPKKIGDIHQGGIVFWVDPSIRLSWINSFLSGFKSA